MIALTPQVRVLVARDPVDFRRGIDGLVRVCRDRLGSDPFSGAVFAFRNRPGTAIKLLVYDGQGFWLCHKRLSTGRFRHWPKGEETGSSPSGLRPQPEVGSPFSRLLAQELQVLLSGGSPSGARMASLWKEIVN